MDLAIDVIIVPQGAECRAVRQGLKKVDNKPRIIPIPIGTNQLERTLSEQQFWQSDPQRVLMLGLCGSLSPSLAVGDLALYQSCCQQNDDESKRNYLEISSELNYLISHKIEARLGQNKSILVAGLTSQKVITKVAIKRQLATDFSTQVVDMESCQYLNYLQAKNLEVIILRIVGDDLQFDLPNLDKAIRIDGSLSTLALIAELSRTPYSSSKFVINSLLALGALRKAVELIFTS